MLLKCNAKSVEVQTKKGDDESQVYPDQSLEEWHQAHNLRQKALGMPAVEALVSTEDLERTPRTDYSCAASCGIAVV
jgi:hypothetical protein